VLFAFRPRPDAEDELESPTGRTRMTTSLGPRGLVVLPLVRKDAMGANVDGRRGVTVIHSCRLRHLRSGKR
jgi:hypothetical protein